MSGAPERPAATEGMLGGSDPEFPSGKDEVLKEDRVLRGPGGEPLTIGVNEFEAHLRHPETQATIRRATRNTRKYRGTERI